MNAADPAAIFAAATSLWEAVHEHARRDASLNLSESYNGIDELMREVMRIATAFEEWATKHVDFGELGEVWSYFLGDRFGNAMLEVLLPHALAEFCAEDCLRIAFALRLPLMLDDALPLPIHLEVDNPVPGSPFCRLRIRSMRVLLDEDNCEALTWDDDPYDPDFGSVFLSLYGVDKAGDLEHIADRTSYAALRSLACALAPGVAFPQRLTARAVAPRRE